MAKRRNLYRAGDVEGYGFGFDIVGNTVDWDTVAEASETGQRRLVVSMAMLFTRSGKIRYRTKAAIRVPRDADSEDAKRRAYAVLRQYIRTVANRLGLGRDRTPSNTVVLVDDISME